MKLSSHSIIVGLSLGYSKIVGLSLGYPFTSTSWMIGVVESCSKSSCCSLISEQRHVPLSSSGQMTSQFAAVRPPRFWLCGLSRRTASIWPERVSGASLSSASGSQLVTDWSMVSSWDRVSS